MPPRILSPVLFALLLPAPAMAQSFEESFADLTRERRAVEAPPEEDLAAESQSIKGSWALRLGGAVIFRFDVNEDGGKWSGVWARPGSFASDGDNFGSLKGPNETHESSAGREVGGWIELTFPDDRPGAVPDIFRFNLVAPNRVEMIYVDTGLAPYTLERVTESTVLGPWEPGRVYGREGSSLASSTQRPEPLDAPDAEVQGPPARPVFEGR